MALTTVLTIWAMAATFALIVCLPIIHGLWTRQLPFPDYGSFAFCCRDEKAKRHLVRILRQSFGMKPRFRLDTGGITRALYSSDLILNTNPPELREKLGDPGGGLILPSNDPWEDAQELEAALIVAGYQASVIVEERSLSNVCLVRNNLLVNAVIGFRKSKTKMGKPPAWHD